MLAYREWRVLWEETTYQPILYSTVQSMPWKESVVTADKVPGNDEKIYNAHGIHGNLPGRVNNFVSVMHKPLPADIYYYIDKRPIFRAIGACDFFGVVQVHEDGVIRAEHCRILAVELIVAAREVDGSGENCPCGKLFLVFDDRAGGKNRAMKLKYRIACVNDHEDWIADHGIEVVAETSIQRVSQSLRQRYEVYRLPQLEGPWAERVLQTYK